MSTLDSFQSYKHLLPLTPTYLAPSLPQEFRGWKELDTIREHADWLTQNPRTSFEIASYLFTEGRCSMSDMEIAIHDMAPALYEAGYVAVEGVNPDLGNTIWVKG